MVRAMSALVLMFPKRQYIAFATQERLFLLQNGQADICVSNKKTRRNRVL